MEHASLLHEPNSPAGGLSDEQFVVMKAILVTRRIEVNAFGIASCKHLQRVALWIVQVTSATNELTSPLNRWSCFEAT